MAVLVDPIRSETDYDAALVKIEELWGAEAGTPAGDKLDILVTLVEAWENAHYPMDPPDPVEAIKFRLEQAGKSQADLARVLGSRSRASEVLSGKRELTMAQVKAIRASYGISADTLVALDDLKARAKRAESEAVSAKRKLSIEFGRLATKGELVTPRSSGVKVSRDAAKVAATVKKR